MTKGRVALPFGVMAVTTASQTLFVPDSTCRKQVRLLLMNKRNFQSNWMLVEGTAGPSTSNPNSSLWLKSLIWTRLDRVPHWCVGVSRTPKAESRGFIEPSCAVKADSPQCRARSWIQQDLF